MHARIFLFASIAVSLASTPTSALAQSSILFYDAAAGQGELYATSPQGAIAMVGPTQTGWRSTWSRILAGNFDGAGTTDLLFYDPTRGEGEFYATDGHGGIRLLGATQTGWRRTWTQIVAGDFDGRGTTDLLFYDPATGEGEFYATDGRGGITRIGATQVGWRRTWSQIVAGNFDGAGTSDLLFYDPATGEGELYATDGRGNIARIGPTQTGWRRTWSQIIPGNFDGVGTTDLLFYDPASGEGEFYATDGRGNIARIGPTQTGWRRTWSQIVAASFDGNGLTDLLFYDPTARQGELYATDGRGGIRLLAQQPGWRATWRAIVAAMFAG